MTPTNGWTSKPCPRETEGVPERHLVSLEVDGRPATFATAHEEPWKEAIRSAVASSGVRPAE
jgi:hypothetical protein